MSAPEEDWLPVIKDFTTQWLMGSIKSDLSNLGIVMDEYISERSLVAAGEVDNAINLLKEKKLIYQVCFSHRKEKSQTIGSPDHSFYLNRLILEMMWIEQSKNLTGLGRTLLPTSHIISTKLNVDISNDRCLGADHGGYVRRMQAAVNAASIMKQVSM